MPNTRATPASGRFQVRAEQMPDWLTIAVDPGGLPFQETYGFDDTFGSDGDDLHEQIQILVSQAQTDGVLSVPHHHLELWQVADEGFLLAVHAPHGPRLCSRHLSIGALLPDKTAGSGAIFAVLDRIAHIANQLLDEQDHAASRNLPHVQRFTQPQPAPAPACAADPVRIREWLASPGTGPGVTGGSIAEVWDLGAATAVHDATDLVDQAQRAGVFGVPDHLIALLYVPSDEDIDQDGFLVLIDTPAGQRLCSDWLRVDDVIPADLRGRVAAIDCLTTLASTVDAILTPPAPVADQNANADPSRVRVAGAFPPPGTTTAAAGANPPPPAAPGPAASSRRNR